MKVKNVHWNTFDKAVQGVLTYFVENQRDTRVIYFDGWRGFGASAVLRAVADELTSRGACPELHIDKVIHIDCSTWKSRRAMQRAIAVELKLDATVLEVFDKKDEEDDFNAVDEGSRSEIASVVEVIEQAIKDHKFMVVFHNGTGEYIDLGGFGLASYRSYFMMLWTFRRRFQAMEPYSQTQNNVKFTHFFAYETAYDITSDGIFFQVLHKEAAVIAANYPCMREIDPERIVHCCLYGLFLYLCLPKHLKNEWAARASTYWVCDGIIQGDRAWEISRALSKEIKWDLCPSLFDEVRERLIESSPGDSVCFERFNDTYFSENKMAYPSIVAMTSKTIGTPQDIKAINAYMSSYFLAPDEISNDVLLVLADGLFDQSTNLHVLHLSHCAFSFASPPFIDCQNLRFLGLDHCKDNESTKQMDPRKWQFLQSLWVLDLIYTAWYQVFSKEIAHLIINLEELKIVGRECWQYIGELQGKLPDVHRPQIVKSMDQPKATTYVGNCLIEHTKLEILDLSGNTNMTSLPANLSKARKLQVLVLDGCHGLENIMSGELPSSLRSLSFDGYGSATEWASSVELPTRDLRPSSKQVLKDIKTSVISFKGCIRLENLFLRGLPNLVELDLSGTAIKILDFTSMVVEVSCLKRLFLLGCKQLRAIKWDNSGSKIKPDLQYLCIDTRPGPKYSRSSIDKNRSFQLHVHAIIVDARLARSLWDQLINKRRRDDVDMSIHVTSSTVYSEVQSEGTYKDNISQLSDHVNMQQQDLILARRYHDVLLSMVGDAPMQSFPLPPTTKLSHHIEIAQGSHNLESELVMITSFRNLAGIATYFAKSLHVHNISTSMCMPGGSWDSLEWYRIEKCPKIETVFPKDAWDFYELKTMWVSDLLMARCLWSKGSRGYLFSFQNLQHLHLRSCPRLQFVLPVWVSSFPSLKTLHVIHCGSLHNIFVPDERYPEEITIEGVAFPKLAIIHLHDLPMLRQICDVEFKMVAPVLETIKIRGCWGLRRLPAVAAGREPKPAVEIEKEVWDALEWDGMEAGHHPSLFQTPVHSRYYKKKLPRGSVLR